MSSIHSKSPSIGMPPPRREDTYVASACTIVRRQLDDLTLIDGSNWNHKTKARFGTTRTNCHHLVTVSPQHCGVAKLRYCVAILWCYKVPALVDAQMLKYMPTRCIRCISVREHEDEDAPSPPPSPSPSPSTSLVSMCTICSS